MNRAGGGHVPNKRRLIWVMVFVGVVVAALAAGCRP